ncbi:hybrid sensor histidine kinase/response regulator [Paludisphaera soli]|uniref:hybrid sensor histidine kinase/response regulator n=1 Tax=Paludisphaera soli TaxID=2712865 RepID=UPI0013EC5001|nr:ATP-binding protein [Paludisphaera soli]
MADHVHLHGDGGGGFLADLFEVFTPRRQCMNYEADVVWLHFASDLLIAMAYFSIPLALLVLVRRRKDLDFNWMFLLFALFIVLCGATHLFGVLALWMPLYRLDGLVKLATALASVGTAGLLWRLLPLALALPSPESLRLVNRKLEAEVAERTRAEEEVRRARDELERRVEERTRELRASEASFRQLADAMPQIVWTARPDGRLDYYNRRWYDYTGMPEGEAGDASWEPVLHPDDLAQCHQTWYRSVRSGEPYEIEYRFRDHRTGAYRWHLGRALPMKDEAGAVVRWFGTCTDIEDQKRTEAALRESDRRKDEFLAMLSHELRNPLAAIRMAVETLALSWDGGPDPWAREVLDRQVGNLSHMLDDLLDVARVTRGKVRIRKQLLDVGPVLDQAVAATRPLMDDRKHRLERSGDLGPLLLEADPVRLEQILVNLLTNAAKYTPAGGAITLDARQVGDQVVFRVRDTGMGIKPEVLPNIFDLFVQSDRALDRSEGGLGVGLTIVKGLVELHGGSISAASGGPGRGSEFVVRLPAAAARPAAPPRPAASGAGRHGSRVLIVDDNKDLARGLARLLRLLGREVETAHDGPEGIAVARTYRPDVILLDIGLPSLNGYDVARTLRGEGFDETLIIAISGYGQEEDRRLSREAGMDHHLTKPVDLKTIAELIA